MFYLTPFQLHSPAWQVRKRSFAEVRSQCRPELPAVGPWKVFQAQSDLEAVAPFFCQGMAPCSPVCWRRCKLQAQNQDTAVTKNLWSHHNQPWACIFHDILRALSFVKHHDVQRQKYLMRPNSVRLTPIDITITWIKQARFCPIYISMCEENYMQLKNLLTISIYAQSIPYSLAIYHSIEYIMKIKIRGYWMTFIFKSIKL